MNKVHLTDKKKSQNKANMKWALFAKYYFDPDSKTFNDGEKSAVRAGFSESYARTITTRSGYDKVRQGLADALDQLGVDNKYLAGKIKELLDAKKIIRNVSKDTVIEEIDSRSINYGLTHAIAVRGDKATEKVDISASDEAMEALARLRQALTIKRPENQ